MLHATSAGRDDEGLPEGMDMPVGPGPALEGDRGAVNAGRGLCPEPVPYPDGAGEVFGRRQIGRRRPRDDD